MAPHNLNDKRQRARHEPFFDVHPQTDVSIEVFYADPALEILSRRGCAWFWWPRRPGSAPEGRAIGPFASSYAAYRHAIIHAYRVQRSAVDFQSTQPT